MAAGIFRADLYYRIRVLESPLPPLRETAPRAGGVRPLAEVERDAIAAALRVFQGNRTLAARALGIGRSTLPRKIRGYRW